MREIKSLEELHLILLNIGKAFHQICEEAHIPYFMAAGTLLGAVRHKGFIPWDDDMDFVVPRVYFDKLKLILKEKLPSHYSVLDRQDGIVISGIFKIADNRTEQDYRWNVKSNVRFGINIDIFPLDYANSRWKNKLIFILRKIQGMKGLDAARRPYPQKLFAYIVKGLLVFVGTDTIQRIIDNRLIEKEGVFLVNHYGAYEDRELMPEAIFGKPVLMPFEDTEFYGVQDTHGYLTIMYGDYMVLPPEGKRHTHLQHMYWK